MSDIQHLGEKIDSVASFTIGGIAITYPMMISSLTTWIQLLTMVVGLIVVIFRAIYEYKLWKKNR